MPVTRWSVTGFSLLALVAGAVVVYRQALPVDLVSLREANAQLAFEIREFGVHLTETPERMFADPDGQLSVQIYSDHCVAIQRVTPRGKQTRLIPDLALQPATAVEIPHRQVGMLMPLVVDAAGRCLNPHPGPFETAYGERNGCLVQVWRAWKDGCQQWMWFDTCQRTWQTNPDGTPRVQWVKCYH